LTIAFLDPIYPHRVYLKPEITMSNIEKKTCCCGGTPSSDHRTEVTGDASKVVKYPAGGTAVAAAKSGPTATLAART
jgi:hypothetical protein